MARPAGFQGGEGPLLLPIGAEQTETSMSALLPGTFLGIGVIVSHGDTSRKVAFFLLISWVVSSSVPVVPPTFASPPPRFWAKSWELLPTIVPILSVSNGSPGITAGWIFF